MRNITVLSVILGAIAALVTYFVGYEVVTEAILDEREDTDIAQAVWVLIALVVWYVVATRDDIRSR